MFNYSIISIKRRGFPHITGKVATFFILFSSNGFSCMSDLYYRIKGQIKGYLKTPVEIPPDNERSVAVLHSDGEKISIETALNSRCNSDYNGDPKHFHWGMFDENRKLSKEQIKKIIDHINFPRFTNHRIEIQSSGNILTFLVDNHVKGIQKDWVMVESGMQNQAAGLICAALGIGMVFKSLGDDGAVISESDYGTTRIKLAAMKPSYDNSFWSRLPPDGTKPWKRGNLLDPVRGGKVSLLAALGRLRTENRTGRKATDESLSQLLWAARGRTPHFYKSRPWGMTIPVSKGHQNISSVYVISNSKLSIYVNWEKNRPTHSISTLKEIERQIVEKLENLFPPRDRLIILGKNEHFQRANWEVGYQLLNLTLQAQGLNINYKASLVDEEGRGILSRIGVKNPVAVFSI